VLLYAELSSQRESTVSNLREARDEKLAAWYANHHEQLTTFFNRTSRCRNLNEVVEVRLVFICCTISISINEVVRQEQYSSIVPIAFVANIANKRYCFIYNY